MSDSQVDQQFEAIEELEATIGLPAGFFKGLYMEDDWSFVVKLHALIEAAITHLLVEHMNDPRLLEPLSHLPLSDKTAGKMAFVKRLDLLDQPYRRYVAKLSELRNNLVHNVSQTRFMFTDMVSSLTASQQRDLASSFAVGLRADTEMRTREFMTNPKSMIWISALCLLSIVSARKKIAASKRELEISNRIIAALEGHGDV